MFCLWALSSHWQSVGPTCRHILTKTVPLNLSVRSLLSAAVAAKRWNRVNICVSVCALMRAGTIMLKGERVMLIQVSKIMPVCVGLCLAVSTSSLMMSSGWRGRRWRTNGAHRWCLNPRPVWALSVGKSVSLLLFAYYLIFFPYSLLTLTLLTFPEEMEWSLLRQCFWQQVFFWCLVKVIWK